ncbi:MAG TPA: chromate efflux transporter [Xanthomonadaceae bacterium]
MSQPSVTSASGDTAARDHGIPFATAVRVWTRVALLSFGGPAGQVAVMHRILVEELRWVGEGRFLHALSYCMLLPGPEAQQLAIYLGWLLHKTRGGLVAGGLFVLPGFLTIMALSWLYALYGHVGVVAALFFGLKAAVLAIVVQAIVRVGSRALKTWPMRLLALASFVAIFAFGLPFPLLVLAAAAIGYASYRAGSKAFVPASHGSTRGKDYADEDSALGAQIPAHARPDLAWSLRVGACLLLAWLVPVGLLCAYSGNAGAFRDIAVFFSKMAVVTFGGAYAVLAYVAQQAVQHYHWLNPGEMLDGLGMAESTPGPLIMVVQFVGFMGAWRNPAGLSPLLAGTLGGVLTTWVTFVPCFLWIFVGAPFIERLRGNEALAASLAAITAAIVGVIASLAFWFAVHFLFAATRVQALPGIAIDLPVPESIRWPALALTACAFTAAFVLRLPTMVVLLASSLLGIAAYLLLPGL